MSKKVVNCKLKKKYKTRWLKDLRGGAFKQCRAELCTIDNAGSPSYCCLGVLATQFGQDISSFRYDDDTELLNKDICEATGLTTDTQNKLSEFNDFKRWSFNKIASYIERYL